MANFTSEIKSEILNGSIKGKKAKRAALSAFLRTSGELSYDFFSKSYGFEFVTENEAAAEFFFGIIEDIYEVILTSTVKTDRLTGKEKLRFEFKNEEAEEILTDLRILEKTEDGNDFVLVIKEDLFSSDSDKLAYIKGAFLGGGSCTVPFSSKVKTGYHLQFSFPSWQIANDFCELLSEFDVLTKQIEHKGSFVVYVNSKEAISDFLSMIGADRSLRILSEIVDRRDNSNNANRTSNCASGNKNRAQKASGEQIEAIERIKDLAGLDILPPQLKELALLRLSNREYSLQELADKLSLSKSCVNHRMKKIIEIYETLEK